MNPSQVYTCSPSWTLLPPSSPYFIHMCMYEMRACVLSHFRHVQLFAAPWTAAHQAPLSMGFSRQKYWSGLLHLPPGDLPDPGTDPCHLHLRHWQAGSLPLAPPGKPPLFLVGKDHKQAFHSPRFYWESLKGNWWSKGHRVTKVKQQRWEKQGDRWTTVTVRPARGPSEALLPRNRCPWALVPNSWADSWTHLSLPRIECANLPLFSAPLSMSSQYLFPSGPSAQR